MIDAWSVWATNERCPVFCCTDRMSFGYAHVQLCFIQAFHPPRFTLDSLCKRLCIL
ncbi:hypothetical protein EMIT0P2_60094 [Pseudomonas sp. IT-P2]